MKRGDYAGAKRMLDTLATIPRRCSALDGLRNIPADIDPVNEQ